MLIITLRKILAAASLLLALNMLVLPAWAQEGSEQQESAEQRTEQKANAANETSQTVSQRVQNLKNKVLTLNKNLFILEEELLYPAATQIAVYVSLDVGEYFSLDAVKLTLDDELVTTYLYTDRQLDALQRGGIQRLYMGNIKSGSHELVAVFTGRGPQGRDYRRATNLSLNKADEPLSLELKIVDSSKIQQPEFVIKAW